MKFIENLKTTIDSVSINKKEFWSSVLFLSLIYAVSFISVFRANYNYVDDIRRTVEGNNMSGTFSRHISQFLSLFVHTSDHRLTDISPVPQLLACVLLAITGFIVVKVMCKKPTKYLLLATLPVGLSPYFLECISYKFDAPYMALSILASVFPFLFMHTNRWLYACASVISLLIMTMTYQASSGIFVMMSLYFFFRTILYKSDSVKNAFIFLGISCLSYIVALGLFRFCFLEVVSSYVSTDIEVNYNIADLFWKHIVRYFALIYSDWNVIWKITALIIVIIFYVKNIMFSKLHKVAAFFIATLFLTLLACSVFGVYTLLEKPLIEPRAMYSVGVLLAILSVDICFSLKKIFSFPVFILCWCFFVFAFAYGNCLADQKRYDAFRAELLLNDLAHIIIEKPAKSYKFACINSVGFSAVVKNTAQDNPIIKRLIYVTVRNSPFTYISLAQHYKFPLYWDKKLAERKDEIPIVFDSFYHTIKKNDDEIVVILK